MQPRQSNFRRRPAILAGAMAAIIGLSAGCDDSARRIAQLQRELTDEKSRNDQSALKAKEQRGQIAMLSAQVAAFNNMPADRWDLIPKADRIEIDRYSALHRGRPQLSLAAASQPTTSGPDQYVRLYLKAYSSDGLAIRVNGSLEVSMFDLSDSQTASGGGGLQPRPLGVYRFDPRTLPRHFRSGLASNLFAFDLPLSGPAGQGGVTVHVALTDLLTGKLLTSQKLVTPDQ